MTTVPSVIHQSGPNPKSAFFAWRTTVLKRASTDSSVLDDPLVSEAFSAGYFRGSRDRLSLEAEFAGAIEVNRRVADLLEQMVFEREAVAMVGSDDDELEELPF